MYRASKAGKEAKRKWRKNNKEWYKNYKLTDIWIENKKRYLKGEASKKRRQRYESSDKGKAARKKYHAKPDVKIIRKIKSTIGNVFRRMETTKDQTSLKYLGCTIEEFKIYIEKKFEPGMTWENHGKTGWHFDHIRPISNFNFNIPREKTMCNHYTNFQPLWAKENIRKSNKII